MSKLIQKISLFTILILGIISVILVALIYFGGTSGELAVGEEKIAIPKFTDPLLIWTAILIGVALLITVVVTLWGFIKNLIAEPKSAIKTLIPIVIFILVFLVAWLLGTDNKISIIGYEGTDNVGFWAHFTDMIIYSMYALLVAIILTIIGSAVYKKIK
jgi:multisubunit Na+/H+ antiporter MnhC subunit